MAELGAKMREIVEDRGLRLNHVAEKMGITYTTLNAIFTGRRNPSLQVLVKFAYHTRSKLSDLCCLAGYDPLVVHLAKSAEKQRWTDAF